MHRHCIYIILLPLLVSFTGRPLDLLYLACSVAFRSRDRRDLHSYGAVSKSHATREHVKALPRLTSVRRARRLAKRDLSPSSSRRLSMDRSVGRISEMLYTEASRGLAGRGQEPRTLRWPVGPEMDVAGPKSNSASLSQAAQPSAVLVGLYKATAWLRCSPHFGTIT